MIDPRATADDAFDALFSDLTTGPTPAPPVASTASSPGGTALPSRRQVREQARAAERSAPRRERRRAQRLGDGRVARSARASRAASSSASRAVVAPPAAPASIAVPRAARTAGPEASAPVYADARTGSRKPLRALVTMTAVAGLIASAGLPAYALTATATPTTTEAATAKSALAVSADVAAIDAEREEFSATSRANLAQQRSNAAREANWQAYQTSGAREAGDDYPYYSELSLAQGGGLSPLNYFYRECVDFVAWKLNEDAGSTEAPYLMDWSYLTPAGGDASAWKYNWERHGWTVSTVPVVGSVAWFGGHVAYVAGVNDDGTVYLQEYNYQSNRLYGTRTIPASEVPAFLYAPPVPGSAD